MKETRFKQTEVGLIPEDWDLCKIGSIMSVGSVRRIHQSEWKDRGVRFFRARDIVAEFKKTPLEDKLYISEELYHRYTQTGKPLCDDLLVTGVGTIGVPYLIEDEAPLYFKDGNIIWFKNNHALNGKFLYYSFASTYVQNYIKESAGIGTVGTYTINSAKTTPIMVPSCIEQSRIASALSEVDALLSSLDKVIAKKQAIEKGTAQQLVVGKTRLKGYGGEWREYPLCELLEYEQPSKYLVSSTDYTENGTPVLTAGKTFILGYTNETFGIYKSVPVIIFDDFTTDSKYVTMPFKAKSSAMKMLSLRDNRNNLRFICELMQTINFPVASHKRNWISEYSKIKVKVPSFEEQQAIASVLTEMDAEISALKAKRKKYKAMKQGMMQQLLTGKIRLVE